MGISLICNNGDRQRKPCISNVLLVCYFKWIYYWGNLYGSIFYTSVLIIIGRENNLILQPDQNIYSFRDQRGSGWWMAWDILERLIFLLFTVADILLKVEMLFVIHPKKSSNHNCYLNKHLQLQTAFHKGFNSIFKTPPWPLNT